MAEPTELRPLKRSIPPDLQKQVEDIKTKVPRTTGPPGDLDEEKKRWLIVGICLHSIISPLLRTYVDSIISNLYNSLVSSDSIDTQGYHRYLKKYPATNRYFLNYESINNNRTMNKNYWSYDYRVTSHVDLSKLFLQPNMARYSGIDGSCDSSALLGMIINISSFPRAVQTDAEKIRSDIRNPWAHCDFTEWTTTKYTDLFQLMEQLVKDLGLSSREENKVLGELNTWATNGQNYLSGTVLGLEIVEEIRQHTNVLSEYVQTLCTETDSQFINVKKELKDLENSLQDRIRKLENTSMKHEVELKHYSDLATSVSQKIENLEAETKRQQEDPIPKNIRDLHNQYIKDWENDESSFLKTRATYHILKSIPSNNCIIVTGSSGCGKSSSIHHAALQLRDSYGYVIIPVLTGPLDIINYYNENTKQVFVADDICGKESINTHTLNNWRDNEEKMEKVFKTVEKEVNENYTDSKLLISCRLHIYKESQFQLVKLLTRKECNLLSPELCLLEEEKIQMAKIYNLDNMIDNIMEVQENVGFFPLLCKLSKDKKSEEVLNLFTAPVDSIRKNIKHIVIESNMQFCALVLCILYDDGFDTDWLKLKSISETEKRKKLADIVREFDIDLSREMSRKTLKLAFDTLDGTYLRQRGSEYRMIHDMIYKLAAVICGQKLTECFIKYAPSVFIRDHFIFKSINDAPVKDDVIMLSGDEEEEYFERLLIDLKESIIISTFHNKQLIYQPFRKKLIQIFGRSDEAKQILKGFDHNKKTLVQCFLYLYNRLTTPLRESVTCGYYDLVHFLIDTVKCDMNITDQRGRSLLYLASKGGKTDVVKLLLQKNIDMFNCQTSRWCPLYVACAKGHTNIVNMLLQNNAHVYQCQRFRFVLVECLKGHTVKTPTLFSDLCLGICRRGQFRESPYRSARGRESPCNCPQRRDSPLYVACKGGYINIVKLLLQIDADVYVCNILGETPLYTACEGGHKDIVELLLQNKADVVLFGSNANLSPLHAAYKGRKHIDIVKLLLENIDVWNFSDKLKIYRILRLECENGHTELLELLLKKTVDINRCDRIEKKTLLHVVCSRGHASIVNLLLKNKADISQCNSDGESPLYIACANGHTDIVEILLQNNADVSQCKNNGETPFQAASAKGHTDILNILLENKADAS